MALWIEIAGKFCSMRSWESAIHRWIDLTKMITWKRRIKLTSYVEKLPDFQLPTFRNRQILIHNLRPFDCFGCLVSF